MVVAGADEVVRKRATDPKMDSVAAADDPPPAIRVVLAVTTVAVNLKVDRAVDLVAADHRGVGLVPKRKRCPRPQAEEIRASEIRMGLAQAKHETAMDDPKAAKTPPQELGGVRNGPEKMPADGKVVPIKELIRSVGARVSESGNNLPRSLRSYRRVFAFPPLTSVIEWRSNTIRAMNESRFGPKLPKNVGFPVFELARFGYNPRLESEQEKFEVHVLK